MSTTAGDGDLVLAGEFPAATRERWLGLVAGVLRKSGALGEDDPADGAEALLRTRLHDGIDVQPLYTAADASPDGAPALGVDGAMPGLFPYTRGSRAEGNVAAGWDLRQRHVEADPARAREAILADLENGVNSIWLRAGGEGLAFGSLGEALDGVDIGLAPIVLDAGDAYEDAAAALLALHADRGTPAEQTIGSFGADPIGLEARTGREHDLGPAVALAARAAGETPRLRAIVVDALPHHEAGASDAQELAAGTATGLAYLRALVEAGVPVGRAATQLEFRWAATADQFSTICKLRAARRLWARVCEVAGVAHDDRAAAQRQHAVTSPAMMTRRDPWTNMLRTTVACFGAGVGGADAITVLPFDSAIGVPDAFARRVARNTQSLLVAESHVAGVVDPAGGSWYVERLTEDLARAAWAGLRSIEGEGGIVAALRSGSIAREIETTWEERRDAIAHRADPITGVSEFPDLDERAVDRPATPPRPGGVADAGLPVRRYAEPYEALRDASDAWRAEHGDRPSVFLATIGPVAQHNARATFAANTLQAGGIATTTAGPTEGPDDVVAAFRESGATVACLCSSDRLYGEHAEATAKALRDAGATDVLLAGDPGDRRDAYGAAGITRYLFVGCDALGELERTFDALGVAR